MAYKVLFPWKMYADYEDGTEFVINGNDEEDCMYKIGKLTEKHGKCIFYTGAEDEDYVGGEYIGEENFLN